uniref:TF-B3 domain-containing protein n=1 Tax=Leersia perrieri TaxID=77586 RepID=A0A0D9Y108_9ORYZ
MQEARNNHRMRKSFTTCKECISYHYWNHMGEHKKSFLYVMIGDCVAVPAKFANSIRRQISEVVKLEVPNALRYILYTFDDINFGEFETEEGISLMGNRTMHSWSLGGTIPKMFAKNFQGHLFGAVKLEVPDGKTYDVEIAKEHNELVFRSGWEVFASAYELEHGDFLVFGYSGNFHFKVWIFNPSSCEKELSCVVMNRSISDDNHRQSPRSDRMHKSCTTCMDCITNHYWRHMDDRERYFFKVILSVSDIKDALAIPKKFAANVRGKISEQVRLEVSDDASSSEDSKVSMHSGGLQRSKKFRYVLPMMYNMTSAQKAEVNALEKKIQPQIPLYITAVEKTSVASGSLVFSKDYAVRYLLDQNKTITLCQSGGSKTWHISLDIDTDNLYAISTGWLDFFRDNLLQEGDICVFEASKSKKGVTLTFHPFKESHCPKPPEEESQRKKIQSIQPEIPVFLAVMRNSNCTGARSLVSWKLIPVDLKFFSVTCASRYLPDEDQIMRLRLPKTKYKWKAAFQLNRNTNLRMLTKGWGKFVNDNKLDVHDICLFQLMTNKKKLTMTVHIIRKEDSKSICCCCVVSGSTYIYGCFPAGSLKPSFGIVLLELIGKDIEEPENSGDIKKKSTKSFYNSTTMCDMNSAQKAEVDALEKKIQPQIPYYITAMDKASVAAGFMQDMQINLDINTDGPYALSTGWLDFIQVNQLQEEFAPASTKSDMNGVMKIGDHSIFVSRSTRIADQQKRKIKEILQVIQYENPVFAALMRRCSVGHSNMCIMPFSSDYAKNYLPHLDQTIRLQLPKRNNTLLKKKKRNNAWETEYQIKEGRHWLVQGWRKFVRDNKLEIDDICLFQLMKDEEQVTMMVHIIRKQQDISSYKIEQDS